MRSFSERTTSTISSPARSWATSAGGEKEDIYQWEVEFRRTLSSRAVFTAGFQRSVRVSNIPARSVPDHNTWLGLEYAF